MVVRFVILISLLALAAGCSTVKTTRMEPIKPTDLSGVFNDTDARTTAATMVEDCLQGRWISTFAQERGRPPVVIVGAIRNKTAEHIPSDVFVDTLQKALINSGTVKFVASKDERQEIRDERKDQQAGNTEGSTVTLTGHETGADFMLQGNINAMQEAAEEQVMIVGKKHSTSFYQVTLELINLKTNEKTWIGQKEVKKSVERRKVF